MKFIISNSSKYDESIIVSIAVSIVLGLIWFLLGKSISALTVALFGSLGCLMNRYRESLERQYTRKKFQRKSTRKPTQKEKKMYIALKAFTVAFFSVGLLLSVFIAIA